ncbi:MAG TPA: signal peptide peptidase SppA [Armatimonadota bacterium]|nr:signal peptide peptidase SppA [Armatimonadota bacterium]
MIKVTGVISTISTVSPFFGSTSGSESICEQIRQAEKDRDTKALVLRINSPGGSAAGSQEIYAAIEEYKRKTGNPVIASMGDVAASGGYYVAAPCDRIMALPATMTGSIGVIFETIEYHQLMKNLGVEPHTITSGPFKDSGSPFRAMTPEDEEVFRAMIDDVFDQFVTAVVDGRGMEEEVVRKLADGRVYTGRQAVENGLIDETGTFYDAIMLAATEAGIQGEPAVRFYGRVSLLGGLLTTDMESVAPPQTLPPGLLLDTRLWSASQMIAGQASAAVEAR